jgi:hypothetical protein
MADRQLMEIPLPAEGSRTWMAFAPNRDDLLFIGLSGFGIKRALVLSLRLETDARGTFAFHWVSKIVLKGIILGCSVTADGARIDAIVAQVHCAPATPLSELRRFKSITARVTLERINVLRDEKFEAGPSLLIPDIHDTYLTAVTADGQLCAFATDQDVAIYSMAEGPAKLAARIHKGERVVASVSDPGIFYVARRTGEVHRIGISDTTAFLPSAYWVAVARNGSKLCTANTAEEFELRQLSEPFLVQKRAIPAPAPAGCLFDHDQRVALCVEQGALLCNLHDFKSSMQLYSGENCRVLSGCPTLPLILTVTGSRLQIWNVEHASYLVNEFERSHFEIPDEEYGLYEEQPYLDWSPCCSFWSCDGRRLAVGGNDVRIFERSEASWVAARLGLLEWLRCFQPKIWEQGILDSYTLANDDGNIKNVFIPDTRELGAESIALSSDGLYVCIGFRSNVAIVIPVSCLFCCVGSEIEWYVPPSSERGSRWIVDVCFSPDGRQVALKHSNGFAYAFERKSQDFRELGFCGKLGDWFVDSTHQLRPSVAGTETVVLEMKSGDEVALFPEIVELLGLGPSRELIVHSRDGNRVWILTPEMS